MNSMAGSHISCSRRVRSSRGPTSMCTMALPILPRALRHSKRKNCWNNWCLPQSVSCGVLKGIRSSHQWRNMRGNPKATFNPAAIYEGGVGCISFTERCRATTRPSSAMRHRRTGWISPSGWPEPIYTPCADFEQKKVPWWQFRL